MIYEYFCTQVFLFYFEKYKNFDIMGSSSSKHTTNTNAYGYRRSDYENHHNTFAFQKAIRSETNKVFAGTDAFPRLTELRASYDRREQGFCRKIVDRYNTRRKETKQTDDPELCMIKQILSESICHSILAEDTYSLEILDIPCFLKAIEMILGCDATTKHVYLALLTYIAQKQPSFSFPLLIDHLDKNVFRACSDASTGINKIGKRAGNETGSVSVIPSAPLEHPISDRMGASQKTDAEHPDLSGESDVEDRQRSYALAERDAEDDINKMTPLPPSTSSVSSTAEPPPTYDKATMLPPALIVPPSSSTSSSSSSLSVPTSEYKNILRLVLSTSHSCFWGKTWTVRSNPHLFATMLNLVRAWCGMVSAEKENEKTQEWKEDLHLMRLSIHNICHEIQAMKTPIRFIDAGENYDIYPLVCSAVKLLELETFLFPIENRRFCDEYDIASLQTDIGFLYRLIMDFDHAILYLKPACAFVTRQFDTAVEKRTEETVRIMDWYANALLNTKELENKKLALAIGGEAFAISNKGDVYDARIRREQALEHYERWLVVVAQEKQVCQERNALYDKLNDMAVV